LAMVVLLAFPSPARPYLPAIAGAAAAVVTVVLGAALLAGALPRNWRARGAQMRWAQTRWVRTRWTQALHTAKADIRDGLLARGNGQRIVLASAVVVSGHLATFLIAARTAGATAPLSRLIPLTLLALLAMGVPANVGGFGPREG